MSVSELTLLVLRLGFLLVLWLFIFGIVYALRSDLFGQRARKMQADVAGAAGAPATFPSATPVPSATQPPATAASAPTEQFTARPSPAFTAVDDKATSQNATRLVITSGPKAGTEFPLTGDSITIGRSGDSSLVIRDDYTSTHHARLMLWHDKWMIQDLDSTNGTFLDGNRLAVPTPVPLNTTVKIGATSFELRR
ncbi:FHA domain-containing protein [Cryobacterium sp. TMT2-18-3]|uniref:FHA domain-containing protein FhaB/FipA n=1 Tax=unclassified Cryobacterium TaxID=2649013 RepID=UPI001069E1B4|nr:MULTISPECIES: FHA domain-containing protein [unclassified Cryobacterium]TFC31468.1 FHA domain-containing protein [Cryobacterium sp. TMT2-18-2]TFC37934.1 FHA domain-containing protein [Cryobacterium sp. TMT2-42-4]TFC58031.1 FHA domain-containing protein [Cryobacterium sp. TMT2-15-1]TFC65828.1 FHA domain-containing protein [Cryobacterium sp. TMT2-18-3]